MASNGKFDYAAYLNWPGAKLNKIRPESRFRHLNGSYEIVPTPILTEEDPIYWINNVNIEGGHANVDKMGHTHWGGGNYACIDGSVHRFVEPPTQDAWSWDTRAPSGSWWIMAQPNSWGQWNSR